ncbi:MAG: hypothetical protein JNJ56_02945 [Ignavibacteria bacterium]|nr:hypothetical protein [Ignavibacteria bacterium]
MNRVILSVLLIVFIQGSVLAQKKDTTNYNYPANQYDIKELLRDIFKSKKNRLLDSQVVVKSKDDFAISILPGIAYNPATDIVVGVSATASWYMGSSKTTNNSKANAGVSFTTKKQIKISLQSEIYSEKNIWNLSGDWRFWKYVQDTYGLGTESSYSEGQNMNFNYIRFNESLSRKVVKNLYAGLGYSLLAYNKIESAYPDSNTIIYPSYNSTYSIENGIDSVSYVASGFFLATSFDSRDNTINPYKGVFAEAQYFNYNKTLGSTTNWQVFNYQIRHYQSWLKSNKFITAVWFLGSTAVNGNIPYMDLYSNGWDKYGATGRGYVQGRYRGRDFLYFEIENRVTITKNRFFGMVFFLNAMTATNPENGVGLFDYIAPAGGVGLRFLFDKESRTNLSLDFGLGVEGSRGLFLNIGEFF